MGELLVGNFNQNKPSRISEAFHKLRLQIFGRKKFRPTPEEIRVLNAESHIGIANNLVGEHMAAAAIHGARSPEAMKAATARDEFRTWTIKAVPPEAAQDSVGEPQQQITNHE